MSKRGRKSKNKGGNYERKVADKFNSAFPQFTLCRTKQSGGAHKELDHEALRGDLSNMTDSDFPFGIECKDHKTWALKAWWKQCAEECATGKIPLVVFHQGQEIVGGKVAQKADDFVMLRLEDFIEICKSFIPNTHSHTDEKKTVRKVVRLRLK